MGRRRIALTGGILAALGVVAMIAIFVAAQHPSTVKRAEPVLHAYNLPESGSASAPMMAVAEPPPAAERPVPGSAIQVSVPQFAYSYTLGYRLPADAIAVTQQAHLDLCNRLGPARCQLLSMQRASGEDGKAEADLRLRVASDAAQSFSKALSQAVRARGGRTVDTSVTADDLSKDLVDTDARIRQREILVTRLTDMLRNRQGRVSELVDAERSVAQAQEELDQAKGWLGELRGRVALSQFTIRYTPVTAAAPTPRSFTQRLSEAVVQSSAAVAMFAQILLIMAILILPWALLAVPVVLLVRRWRKRQALLAEDA